MASPTLDELIGHVPGSQLRQPGTRAVAGSIPEALDLTHDSRQVKVGGGFACVRGANQDGHTHAADAVQRGAGWLMVDHRLDLAVPQLIVDDVRAALGPIAAAVHGQPSSDLPVIGVTGTAGKTTVTHAVADLLRAGGRTCDVLGTLDGPRTTPEAPDLQRWLADRRDEGTDAVAIEVSSHALELGRVDGVTFAVGVFTNLTEEHLDFHGDMESYFASKRKLFDGRSRIAVINLDDAYGQRLAAELDPTIVRTHSLGDFADVELTSSGTRASWLGTPIEVALVGRFNLLNLGAAAQVAMALGLDREATARAMSQVRPVRGRMEPVPVAGADITVVVDYSHKPDALRAALESAREFTAGRLWVVFGAGGDRDVVKRPLMGAVAAEAADEVVVTSDNPRSEDPLAIIDEIVAAVPTAAVEPDRDAAIASAIGAASAGDVVLVAGKGHEKIQIVGNSALPFDDVEVARGHLKRRVESMGRRS